MLEAINAEIEKTNNNTFHELYLCGSLSSSHLTKKDLETLERLVEDSSHTNVLGCGGKFFIKLKALKDSIDVIDDAESANLNCISELSESFNYIMQYCTLNDLRMIEFDVEAKVTSLFETFDH